MNKRTITLTSILILAALLLIGSSALAGCAATRTTGRTLFMSGTYGALRRGNYDGTMTIAELKKHGDLALGNFSGLDGEMVGLNGKFYQIGPQGKLTEADDAWTVPFATATFFKADKVISIDKPFTDQDLQDYLNSQLPTPNIFYAMKLTGKFESLKARTLTKLNQPYPSTPYSTITQNEQTFEFNNVEGTVVIVVTPVYAGEIGYPGYHPHFISADGKYGGHVLECRITSGKAEIEFLPDFTVDLPQSTVFYKADFTGK